MACMLTHLPAELKFVVSVEITVLCPHGVRQMQLSCISCSINVVIIMQNCQVRPSMTGGH